MNPEILHLIETAKAKREAAGLMLTFKIPGRNEPWTCYPSTEAVKQKWIANGAKKGWEVL